jgi:hypothetical protein
MTILVVGDSVSFGAELPDQPPDFTLRPNRQEWFDRQANQIKPLRPSQYAWPALLGQLLAQPVVNLSLIGGSNDRIFRVAMTESMNRTYDLIICAWTALARFDLYYQDRELPFAVNSPWVIDDHPWLKTFLTDHYHEAQMLERWTAQLVALESYFKLKGQQYLFLNSMNQWVGIDQPTYLDRFNKNIDTNYYIQQDMYGMTQQYPHGPGGHPLEQAHEFIADRVMERLLQTGFAHS